MFLIDYYLIYNCMCVFWERERERYNDSFEVDNGLVSFLIMVEDSMCKLRNIMPSIAFSRNIKVAVLVFRKSLKPIQQKHIIIWCSSSIPVLIIIRCWIGVWKSYTGRRLKEQNVCSWMNRKFQKKKKLNFQLCTKKENYIIKYWKK